MKSIALMWARVAVDGWPPPTTLIALIRGGAREGMAGLEALSVPSERAETAEPGGVEPEPESMSVDLYQHPAVYAALRAPDPALLAGVRRLIAEHLTAAAVAAGAGRVVVRAMKAVPIPRGRCCASRSAPAPAAGPGA